MRDLRISLPTQGFVTSHAVSSFRLPHIRRDRGMGWSECRCRVEQFYSCLSQSSLFRAAALCVVSFRLDCSPSTRSTLCRCLCGVPSPRSPMPRSMASCCLSRVLVFLSSRAPFGVPNRHRRVGSCHCGNRQSTAPPPSLKAGPVDRNKGIKLK